MSASGHVGIRGDRLIHLHNTHCLYCGCLLDRSIKTKEHVIGRRFVPKGKLSASWNLIAWACRGCNNRKATLEDDVSAISMQPDVWGSHARDDEALVRESRRKSLRSTSSRTGRPVVESSETIRFSVALGPGLTATFALEAPPQIHQHRLFELARMQLVGFFYWLTYSKEKRRGFYWVGDFFPILEARKSDWGNDTHMAFMRMVHTWEARLLTGSELIDGYYRVAIRRHPSFRLWSWALEWNHNIRIVGFFGDQDAALELAGRLPRPKVQVAGDSKAGLALRMEAPIVSGSDVLFDWGPVATDLQLSD